jgi:hypothetical protein
LQEHRSAKRIELHLHGVLDVSTTGGLTVSASQQVIIKAHDRKNPPVIRFTYHGKPADRPLVALTLNTKEATVQDVRFFVNVRESADTEMTALLLQGGSRHTVGECAFLQARPAYRGEKPLSSLVIEAGRQQPEVSLRNCTFLGFEKLTGDGEETATPSGADRGGQYAVVRRGPVRIKAEGCALGPHSAAFRLEKDGGDEGLLSVQSCSVLLPAWRSAAFEVEPGGSAKLEVSESLFSRLAGDSESDGTVLLRTDDRPEAAVYRGHDNCYHDLDGYWAIGDAWQQAGWNDFRRRLSSSRTTDDSRVLLSRPWRLDTEALVAALDRQDLKEAFRILPNLAALRKLGRSSSEVVGTSKVLRDSIVPRSLPVLTDRSEQGVHRFLVVDPKSDDSANGVYSSLDLASRSARPGDTILIRHNGDLPIDPVSLNKKGLGDLTVRPARRFRPVLVLGDPADADAALFRLYDGKLRLEGLEFRLTPTRRLLVQTVVALVGDGECTMRQCVVTLQRGGETRLALATVAETSGLMALDMPPARPRDQGPKLTLEGCFVRGEGDLLAMRGSRPFALEVNKTLAAVSGSLLSVETRLLASPPKDTYRTEVTLHKVTAYVGGSLIRLITGKDPRGLVPVNCKATNCLFVPAGTGKPLISLEGADTEQVALKRDKWNWESGQNAYGPFKHLLAQATGGEEMGGALPEGPDQWKTKPGEDASTFGVELSRTPLPETRFSQMDPAQFTAPRDVQDVGVVLTEVPRPSPGSPAATER